MQTMFNYSYTEATISTVYLYIINYILGIFNIVDRFCNNIICVVIYIMHGVLVFLSKAVYTYSNIQNYKVVDFVKLLYIVIYNNI